MAKKYEELRKKMRPEVRARAEARTRKMLEEMPLQELRQALALSQEQIASLLHVQQATVSKMERRTDMYISTLRSYIEAMGGELVVTAKFSEGSVQIKQFKDLNKDDENRVGC